MPAGDLILSLGSRSVTFNGTNQGARFTDEEVPRSFEVPGMRKSVHGTPAIEGPAYEPTRIWNFAALVDGDTERTLRLIQAVHVADPANQKILIHDLTAEFAEDSPRSRALASGATATADGSQVVYYAQFYAKLSAAISFRQSGKYRLATLSLTELDKVPA